MQLKSDVLLRILEQLTESEPAALKTPVPTSSLKEGFKRLFKAEAQKGSAMPTGGVFTNDLDYALGQNKATQAFSEKFPSVKLDPNVTMLDVPEEVAQKGALTDKMKFKSPRQIERKGIDAKNLDKGTYIAPKLTAGRKQLIPGMVAAHEVTSFVPDKAASTATSDPDSFVADKLGPIRTQFTEPFYKGLTGVDVAKESGGKRAEGLIPFLSEMGGAILPTVGAMGGVLKAPTILKGIGEGVALAGAQQVGRKAGQEVASFVSDSDVKGENIDVENAALAGILGGLPAGISKLGKINGGDTARFFLQSGKGALEGMGPDGRALANFLETAYSRAQSEAGRWLAQNPNAVPADKVDAIRNIFNNTFDRMGNIGGTNGQPLLKFSTFEKSVGGVTSKGEQMGGTLLNALTGSDRELAEVVVKALYHKGMKGEEFMSDMAQKLSQVTVLTKLGRFTTAITNASQPFVNVPLRASMSSFGKALGEMVLSPTARAAARDLTLRSGALTSSIMKESVASMQGGLSKTAQRVMEISGFSPIERFNRALTSATAKIELESLWNGARSGSADALAKLQQMGYNPNAIRNSATPSTRQIEMAAQWLNNQTQFRGSALDVPPVLSLSGAGGDAVKLLGMFKSFGFQQTYLFKNALMDSINTGKALPVITIGIKMGVIPPAVGLAVHTARSIIKGLPGEFNLQSKDISDYMNQAGGLQTFFGKVAGKDGAEVGKILDLYSEAGGLGIMMDALDALGRGEEGVRNFLTGPAIGTVAKGGGIAEKLMSGNPSGAVRDLLGQLPLYPIQK